MIRIDCDKQWEIIAKENKLEGALPRQTKYGDAPKLIPYGEAYPEGLVDPSDYKEVIQHCHDRKIFPVYHQYASWAPKGFEWSQNGLGYCWTWSGTGSVMDCRAREGKPTVMLSPVSMGYLVGWRNRGNYLESFIEGAMKHGIAPASYVPNPFELNPRNFKDGWEEAAYNYRIAEVWDTDPRNMIQHAISVLRTGTPLYIAYNWWGHALVCVGVKWSKSERNNLTWLIRNSHGENDVIEMTGSRGVPDEAFGIRATETPMAALAT